MSADFGLVGENPSSPAVPLELEADLLQTTARNHSAAPRALVVG